MIDFMTPRTGAEVAEGLRALADALESGDALADALLDVGYPGQAVDVRLFLSSQARVEQVARLTGVEVDGDGPFVFASVPCGPHRDVGAAGMVYTYPVLLDVMAERAS